MKQVINHYQEIHRFVVHSQVYVKNLYKKLGFAEVGDEFDECG